MELKKIIRILDAEIAKTGAKIDSIKHRQETRSYQLDELRGYEKGLHKAVSLIVELYAEKQ